MIEQGELTEWQIEPPAPPLFKERVRRLPWRLWATVLGIVIFAFVLMVFPAKFHVYAVFGGLFPSLMALYNKAKFGRASVDVRDLMDLPPVVTQYPVELLYSCNGVVYGRDVGIVSFVEGVVQFQGRKSRFAMAPQYFITFGATRAPKSGVPFRYDFHFDYRGLQFKIDLNCFDSVPDVESDLQVRFQGDIQQYRIWRPKLIPIAILPPLYPEVDPHVGYRKSVDIGRGVVAMALALGVYGAFIYHGGWTALFLVLAVIGIAYPIILLRKGRENLRVLASLEAPSKPIVSSAQMPLEQVIRTTS